MAAARMAVARRGRGAAPGRNAWRGRHGRRPRLGRRLRLRCPARPLRLAQRLGQRFGDHHAPERPEQPAGLRRGLQQRPHLRFLQHVLKLAGEVIRPEPRQHQAGRDAPPARVCRPGGRWARGGLAPARRARRPGLEPCTQRGKPPQAASEIAPEQKGERPERGVVPPDANGQRPLALLYEEAEAVGRSGVGRVALGHVQRIALHQLTWQPKTQAPTVPATPRGNRIDPPLTAWTKPPPWTKPPHRNLGSDSPSRAI